MTLILKAAQAAAEAHRGQARTGQPQTPYIVHPARVAGLAACLPDTSEELVAAAFLHDVVEDTALTVDDLLRDFPEQVVQYVLALTETPPTPGMSRTERKRHDRERLLAAPRGVQQVKLCDIFDNLRDSPSLSQREQHLYYQDVADWLQALVPLHPVFGQRVQRALSDQVQRLAGELAQFDSRGAPTGRVASV